MELLRKISSKTVMGGGPSVIRPLADAGGKKGVALYTVIGIANRVKRGEGDNGPWVALMGRFEARRKDDKGNDVVFSSPQCFLPAPMDEMIAGQLEATEEVKDDDGKAVKDADGNVKTRRVTDSVQFGLEIGVKTADTAVGYEYTTKPVVETTDADPLADLRGQVPAIEAPKK